ncbi:MAG: DedA family protein [Deltaproteobacteria bacterium]|nr:DedA family protein [Deltaproteobacteria bacterium]
MTGLVSNTIEHFTYVGLFLTLVLCGLGLPVPEELPLLTGGFLAYHGITQYPTTLAISFVGVMAGDNSLFFLGRRFGSSILRYLGFVRPDYRQRIERLKMFMDRHGNMTIFYARFLAGVRALVYLTAGSAGMTPRRFVVYDALGAIISVPLAVSIGYFFGNQIDLAIRYIGGFDRVVLMAASVSIIIYLLHLLLGTSRNERGTA